MLYFDEIEPVKGRGGEGGRKERMKGGREEREDIFKNLKDTLSLPSSLSSADGGNMLMLGPV